MIKTPSNPPPRVSPWLKERFDFSFSNRTGSGLLLAVALALAPSARAQSTFYWDTNDATVGFGTAAGTWASPTTNNSTQGWSTSSLGTNALSGTTTTSSSDSLNFGTSTDGLAAGTIEISGAVEANSLTFGSASGAIVLSGGTMALGGTTPTITVNNAANSISSAITGSAGLTKNGTGTITLSGNNSYSGATTVSAGTLKAGSTTALSSSIALSVAAGATVDLGGFNNTISSLSTATGTITDSSSAGNGGRLSIGTAMPGTASAQLFTGSLGLQFYGGGTFNSVLTNTANTYSGGTILGLGSGSTVTRILTASNIGTGTGGNVTSGIFGTGAITIGASTTDNSQLYLFNGVTINNNIVVNTSRGNAGVELGAFRFDGNGTVAGSIDANLADATFNSYGTGNVSVTGAITGNSGLTVMSASTGRNNVTLNNAGAANSYAGNTTINTANATLTLGRTDQISNGAGKGNLIINSGTFNMAGYSETINGLSGNGTLDGVSGTPTLTVGDNNATSTFSGVIKNTAGSLALTKIGTGTVTLSGNNTYSGATTVSAGVLEIGAAGRLGGGSYSGNIANSSTVLYSGTNAQTLSGEISGVGALTKNGTGILTLSGANSYTGATTLNAGTLRIGNNAALGSGNLVVNSASAVIDSAVGTTHTLSNNITLTTNGKIGATTAIGNLTFSGLISGSGNLVVDTLGGVTTLTGLNTFTGNLIVDRATVDGGLSFNSIANAGVASALGAGSSISIGIGASAPYLTYTGNTAASSNRTISLAGSAAYITANSAALTLSGNITSTTQTLRLRGTGGGGANFNELSGVYSGGGSLSVETATGSDVWRISGNNTFTGITYAANNAALIAAHSGAFGSTANGTQVNNNAQILLTENISVGAEALTLNSVAGGTWNGQSGAALRSYTGNNSWAGPITLGQASTIATNSGAGLTLSGEISGSHNLTFNSIGNTTASGNITTGTGTLTKTGAGTLILAGSNTYTGTTAINAGSLLVNGSLAAGSAVTVASGATLGGSGTLNGATTVNGNLTPGNSPGVLSFGSSLSLGSTALTTMELNGTDRGTSHDGINVSGALTYGGALAINVGSQFLSSSESFSLFTFASQSGSLASVSLLGAYGLESFTNNSGIWSVTDSTGNQWNFSQATGSLGFTAVPEPSCAVLVLLGLGGVVLARRQWSGRCERNRRSDA